MNFHGKAVLVYLEEDNITRAYFRIQPLLTQEGNIGADMLKEFPDDGYLRIVPDKNEQHTFKERMRGLCGLCMMDLRTLPSEANKIRTNKNYSPTRGETNQYIIYSDAVRPLADDLMYQVVAENDMKDAITPCVYIRNGANIQGPFRKEDGQPVGETAQLPPDSAEIHTVAVKDGQEILIYWPRPAAAPAKEEAEPKEEAPAPEVTKEPEKEVPPAKEENNAFAQIQEMNQQLSESANRLDAPSSLAADLMPEQPQKPLTGTRLYQAPLRSVTPKRAHNPLMEAVEHQRYAAKYEAPGAVIPQNAELRDVANPVASLKRALQDIWNSPEAQQQAVDVLLSQPSMKLLLSKAMSSDGRDATLTAMKGQLQELEAERLMTLMQLDDAKKNLSAFRDEALAEITRDQQKKLDELKNAEQKAKDALAAADKALEPLNQKCQEAAQKLADMQLNPLNDPRILCPAVGQAAKKAELISRVEKSLTAAGFVVQPGDALALLTAYALSEQDLELCAESESDALLAWQAFANALGCRIIPAYWRWNLQVLENGNAPLFIRNNEDTHPLITHVLTAATTEDYAEYHEDEPGYPYASLVMEPSLTAIPGALPQYPAVSKDAIIREMLHETALSQETVALIHALRAALKAAGRILPLAQVKALSRFIAATQNHLSGGVAEAIDRAVCAYVVPFIRLHKLPADELKSIFAAMPRTLKTLNE